MRILMLGWEFPPFIAGGLGVACHGLTRALDRLGHEVVFILPRPVDRSHASHIKLLSPDRAPRRRTVRGQQRGVPSRGRGEEEHESYTMPGFEHAVFHGVHASFHSPYPSGGAVAGAGEGVHEAEAGEAASWAGAPGLGGAHGAGAVALGGSATHYEGDLVGDAERYARLVVALARHEPFDVIHAHDWLTYPAGLALARVSGRPLVVHVHSTEFDRAGDTPHPAVYEIERRGMHGADRVIAVSMFTRSICVERYGVRPGKVDVVWNGIDRDGAQPRPGEAIGEHDRIVLFLGRITMQKGPEYFIGAAKRVLEKFENVKFVIAGSGDMATRMIELAAQMGIGHRVVFTGFLRGRDVERVYRMADCYVMPSVSEPFGLSALEAVSHDVPVIISKQSGVSEVLTHVLKVDFWDVDEMANKILAVLRHPPLRQTMRQHGPFELRSLTWQGAAEKCLKSYSRAIESRMAMAP